MASGGKTGGASHAKPTPRKVARGKVASHGSALQRGGRGAKRSKGAKGAKGRPSVPSNGSSRAAQGRNTRGASRSAQVAASATYAPQASRNPYPGHTANTAYPSHPSHPSYPADPRQPGSHVRNQPRTPVQTPSQTQARTRAEIREAAGVAPIRVSSIIYFIGCAAWLFTCMLDSSFFADRIDFDLITYVCFAILGVKEFVRLIEMILERRLALWGEWLAETAVFAALVWFVWTGGISRYAYALIFIYSARSVDFRQLAAVCAATISLGLIFVTISSLAGAVENVTTPDARERMYLGFLYALFPAQYMLSVTCLVVYVRRYSFHWIEGLMLAVLNAWFFITTDSRMCFVFALAVIVGALVVRYADIRMRKRGFFSVILALAFVICAAVSIAVAMNYDPSVEWMASLDKWLGGRIHYAHDAIVDFGITPWLREEIGFVGNGLLPDGTRVGGTYNYVDCLYVHLIVRYGVIFSASLLALQTYACFKARHNREVVLLIIFAVIAAHCMLDDLSLQICYNPFLLMLANLSPRR